MKLSYSTWGMPQVPIDVAVAHCAHLGFDGLEMTVIPGWTTDAAPQRRGPLARVLDRPPQDAGHGGRRPGSWWRRGGHCGSRQLPKSAD